jgi:hypothetical protein
MEPTDGLYRSADLCFKIRELGLYCKITDVAQELKDIDTSTIFDHFFDVTNFVLWDKKTSISGVPAQELIDNYKMKDDNEAIAIFSEGQLIAFHITAPNGSGMLMTKEEASKFGEITKNTYVINRTNQEILNIICDKLIAKEEKSGQKFAPS